VDCYKIKICNFYKKITWIRHILGMVYMDLDLFSFCIRKAIGGACDESMVLYHFVIHGPPFTHTK